MVKDMSDLDVYPRICHAGIMGKEHRWWQDRDTILAYLGKVQGEATEDYRRFVEEGIAMRKRADLAGGGLVRSQGGWAEVVSMRGRHQTIAFWAAEAVVGDSYLESSLCTNVPWSWHTVRQ